MELSRASAELSAQEMHLAAAAVDVRLGQLAGAARLSDAARRRFESEGVVAPERWVETLVPL